MSAHVGTIASVNALVRTAFKQPKGDFAERLNSRVTVIVLALSAGLLMSGHFFGDPITCWTPAQFPREWAIFVNQYCYVHGTYWVPLEEELVHDAEERRKDPITYYQWVPYILAVQAFLFYIPRTVWKALCGMSGYDLAGAIRYIEKFWEEIKHNDTLFKNRIAVFEGRPSIFVWEGLKLARKKRGRDLPKYYALFTAFQMANAWLQFAWINSFLQSNMYDFWGPSVLIDLLNGNDWQKTGHFPRITHCDFQRRRPASIQLDTVLCVLNLNIYYEKLCLFLWFWLLFVALVSSYNAVYWIANLCVNRQSRTILSHFLSSSAAVGTNIPSREKFFRCLGKDGLFVLQQVMLNLGDLPASYLTVAMRNNCGLFGEENDDSPDEYLLKGGKAGL